MAERDYLQMAKDAYAASTTYVDSNYRKKWEDCISMFQSRHPADSKYNSESYRHRSKLFRPKSRSMVRKHEAAAAAAFFSNIDVISTDATDQGNNAQVASAAVMKEILNYRLQKTIPWFHLVVGALQDAMTVGVCCSYQYWKHKARTVKDYAVIGIDESGHPIAQEIPRKEVIEDKPCIELIPVENIRIDPGADWIDPVNSSPYVIRMVPMYMVDVRSMMNNVDDKTSAPKWKPLTDGEIRSAMKPSYDQTRQVRDNHRQDAKGGEVAPAIGDFEIVWVHENFMRTDDGEVVYFTLGTEYMLTDPQPLKSVYFHGERPIVIGTAVIEAHRIMPDSPVAMGEQLQREANEIVNQRMDNVKLVLNKRYIAKRGAQVDLKSLVRNVAGSITLANDPVGDVREITFSDVTASSYAEQDRINVDYDELTGNFSQGSVMTNRKMGETVGGMAMVSGAANQITEYTIRTFTESWVERALRQLVKLEQAYETDEVILALAADRAKLMQRFGIDRVTDELLNQELTLTVNVGMGATDPQMKLQKFMGAASTYAQVAASNAQLSQFGAPAMDMAEVGKEIFGLAGYRDGRRFINPEQQKQIPAEVHQQMQMAAQKFQAMQQQLQELAQRLQQSEQEKNALQGVVKGRLIENQAAEDERQAKAADAFRTAQVKDAETAVKVEELRVEAERLEVERQALEVKRLELLRDMRSLQVQENAESERTASESSDRQEQLTQTLQAMTVLSQQIEGIRQRIEKAEAEDANEPPERKEIVITSPSGGVYRGVVVDGSAQIVAPSGAVFNGTIQ